MRGLLSKLRAVIFHLIYVHTSKLYTHWSIRSDQFLPYSTGGMCFTILLTVSSAQYIPLTITTDSKPNTRHISEHMKAGLQCRARDRETRAYWFHGNAVRRARGCPRYKSSLWVWAERLGENCTFSELVGAHHTLLGSTKRYAQHSHEWGKCLRLRVVKQHHGNCFRQQLCISALAAKLAAHCSRNGGDFKYSCNHNI